MLTKQIVSTYIILWYWSYYNIWFFGGDEHLWIQNYIWDILFKGFEGESNKFKEISVTVYSDSTDNRDRCKEALNDRIGLEFAKKVIDVDMDVISSLNDKQVHVLHCLKCFKHFLSVCRFCNNCQTQRILQIN